MGSKLVVPGVTVIWEDAKNPKLNVLNVKDGGRYKDYKKGDLQSANNGAYDELKPDRVVVDLKLDLDKPASLVDVHVRITYSGANPTYGWWNGAKWVKFTQKQVTYANNIADITLPSDWPIDPPIGTG